VNNFIKSSFLVVIILTNVFYAQTERVFIDGQFSDWDSVPVFYEDPSGDNGNGNVDFGELRLFNDEDRLFISLETGNEINFQSDNEITVYIDADNNTATGLQIGGVGVELRYTFGLRYGYVYDENGNSESVEHYQIGMISAPTVSSSRFEISFNRTTSIGGLVFAPEIKIYFTDYDGSDIMPNDGVLTYAFDDSGFEPLPNFSIKKENGGYIRLTAYNVLHDGIFDPNLYDYFQNILTAIMPDIISFEEVSGHSASDMVNLLNGMLPLSSGSWFAAQSDYDVIVASSFPITKTTDIVTADGRKRSAAFLLDLRPKFDTDFLVIGAHLKCCGGETNDAKRQREVDAIMEFIREAKEPGGELTIDDKTPIAILGDMNFVGNWKQPYTLISGDISDNGDYGEDFSPDWDGTAFTDAAPLTSGSPFTFTWYDEGSSYPPGKLDYLIYSDSVLKLKNSFSLFTPFLSDEQLAENGLNASDVLLASDHLPVVADFEFTNIPNVNDESGAQIESFKLYQNYPNPFSKGTGGNPTTVVYQLPKASKVSLKVYNILGKEVAELVNAEQNPGAYKVTFNGAGLASGVYFYRLTAGNFAASKKMALLK
jgi:endonuclease/exonuclease/phosphatase family metal-dependent hydrolase